MNLQELLEQEIKSKIKYTLNTPKSVIVKLNKLIQSTDLKDSHKKTLQEIKGILVGKYPNEQALRNSLKGLQSKINSLNEAKTSKTKVLLLAIVTSLLTACNTAEVISKIPVIRNITNVEKEITSETKMQEFQIEQEIWTEIQRNLKQIQEKPEEIQSDLQRYSKALSAYNPNLEHMQIMIDEARKRGIEASLVLALVAQESSFRESAVNRNRNGTYDYGYFQLNNRWHEQHKGNVPSHIKTALDHLKWCLRTENGDVVRALSRYNTGRPDLSVGERYAQRILSIQSDIDSVRIVSR